jgi:hypothetical protein
MPRYLVEVSEPQAVASRRIARSVNTLGSHFATHADWRHRDGVSIGSMIVEAADSWGALGIVPPALRPDARILPLEAMAAGMRFDAETPAPPVAIAA